MAYEVEEFLHPKLNQGFAFIETVNTITVEEDGRDVTYGLKIAVAPLDESKPLEELQMELTLESNIYFVARCTITNDTFEDFKKQQRLKKAETFDSFVESLQTVLDHVTSNRSTYKAIFSKGQLQFKQQLEFKSVKIFALKFDILDAADEYVRAQAQFRYTEKQHELSERMHLLNDLFAHVQEKNPQLYQQLKRSSKFAKKEK